VTTVIEGTPLPATDDPIDAPFWAATLRGELVVQRCASCGKRRFPPRPACPVCQSFAHEWQPVSGEGRIFSFGVPHPPLLPSFAALAPYNVVLVELAEDPAIRMVGNLVALSAGRIGEINAIDPRSIRIGQPVRAVFDRVADDVALVRWVAI
jgi:hypothetical protein